MAVFADPADAKKAGKIAEWGAHLASAKPQQRLAAATALLVDGSKPALAALREALGRKDAADAQVSILQAVGLQKDKRFAPEALDLLDAPSEAVRKAALAALTALKNGEVLKAVLKRLGDPKVPVRTRAALCAYSGETRSIEAIPLLVRLLSDDSPPLKAAAYENLVRITRLALPNRASDWSAWWEKNDRKTREQMFEDVIARQERRVEALEKRIEALWIENLSSRKNGQRTKPLIEALGCEFPGVRRYAVTEIGKTKLKILAPNVAKILGDPDAGVRGAAAAALGELKSAEATPALMRALKDPDSGVRAASARALGELGAREAVAELTRLLSDRGTAQAAAEALGRIGDRKAVAALATLLVDPGAPVEARRATATALGLLGDPVAAKYLISALEDPNVRWFAVDAVGALGASLPKSPAGARERPLLPAVAPVARILLTDGKPDVREAAAVALSKMGLEAPTPKGTPKDRAKALEEARRQALESLTRAQDDDEARVREQALVAFSRIANSDTDLYESFADKARSEKRYAAAARIYGAGAERLARSKDPKQAAIVDRLQRKRAECLRLAGSLDAAKAQYLALIAAHPADPGLYVAVAGILEASGNSSEDLLALYARARKSAPKESAAWWQGSARVVQRLFDAKAYGEVTAAVEALRKEDPKLGGPRTHDRLTKLGKDAAARIQASKLSAQERKILKIRKMIGNLAKSPKNRKSFLKFAAVAGKSIEPVLVKYGLTHPSRDVKLCVVQALEKTTGRSFGLKPKATKKEIEAAVETWTKWWASRPPAKPAKKTPAPPPAAKKAVAP